MDLVRELHKKKPNLRGVLKSHLPEILQLISEGYKKKDIYNTLKENKLIESDYIYFVRMLKEIFEKSEDVQKGPISNKPLKTKSFQMMELDEDDLK